MATRDDIDRELQAFELLWLESSKRMTVAELAAFARDLASAQQVSQFRANRVVASRAIEIVSDTIRYRSTIEAGG